MLIIHFKLFNMNYKVTKKNGVKTYINELNIGIDLRYKFMSHQLVSYGNEFGHRKAMRILGLEQRPRASNIALCTIHWVYLNIGICKTSFPSPLKKTRNISNTLNFNLDGGGGAKRFPTHNIWKNTIFLCFQVNL